MLDGQDEEGANGDFRWHHVFNRMLPGHGKAITGLYAAASGAFLVSSDSTGDLRIWDTKSWSEASRLKSDAKDKFLGCCFSPTAKWLVAIRTSELLAIPCGGRWLPETSLDVMINPETQQPSQWLCATFSPSAIEVNQEVGNLGADTTLAAVSNTHLTLMDYSRGFWKDMPRRSHSILRYPEATSACFSPCGLWVMTGHKDGQILIWETYQLTLAHSFQAHEGAVTSLASPMAMGHDPPLASGGVDGRVHLWRRRGEYLEQTVEEWPLDGDGQGSRQARIRTLAFSPDGHWLLFGAQELSVCRVASSSSGLPSASFGSCWASGIRLELHERLAPVGTGEDIYAGIFVPEGLVLGTQDGLLNLFKRKAGYPEKIVFPEHLGSNAPVQPVDVSERFSRTDVGEEAPARPLHRVKPTEVSRGGSISGSASTDVAMSMVLSGRSMGTNPSLILRSSSPPSTPPIQQPHGSSSHGPPHYYSSGGGSVVGGGSSCSVAGEGSGGGPPPPPVRAASPAGSGMASTAASFLASTTMMGPTVVVRPVSDQTSLPLLRSGVRAAYRNPSPASSTPDLEVENEASQIGSRSSARGSFGRFEGRRPSPSTSTTSMRRPSGPGGPLPDVSPGSSSMGRANFVTMGRRSTTPLMTLADSSPGSVPSATWRTSLTTQPLVSHRIP